MSKEEITIKEQNCRVCFYGRKVTQKFSEEELERAARSPLKTKLVPAVWHECRKKSPGMDEDGCAAWPSVAPDEDWCGDWEPKDAR